MTESLEHRLAVRVLDALLRENYACLASRVTADQDGPVLVLASGRRVRLAPGHPFQDLAIAQNRTAELELAEVLHTVATIADPADALGVTAFTAECEQTLAAMHLHEQHRARVLAHLPNNGLIRYESLAAQLDHPLYPTSRCRRGLSTADLLRHAPEFAPAFELAWAAVPSDRVTLVRPAPPTWWPRPGDVGLDPRLARTHVLFPVHPLTVPVLDSLPNLVIGDLPYRTVRPTLSMRTVEVGPRTHLKLPLPTSTLGLRNRRSIRPGTLRDGARAEVLLREVLAREPRMRVLLADEQEYGHAECEYLGWLVRHLPEGEIVPVAALPAPVPPGGPPRRVVHELADRYYRSDVQALLTDYLTVLLRWNVTLFVRYGIALEAHQQNLSLVFDGGPPRLLVKDNDGLLVLPDRLRAAGLTVPEFDDERMVTDDPRALANVFVTITLHLAAMAVAQAVLRSTPYGDANQAWRTAAGLVRDALSRALGCFPNDPMARLLRAHTLDAPRLVGKSMLVAGTLVAKERTGARDINKFYGTTGPNYLHPPVIPVP